MSPELLGSLLTSGPPGKRWRDFITQPFMEATLIRDTDLTVSYPYLQENSVLVHLLVFLVLFLPHSSFVSV